MNIGIAMRRCGVFPKKRICTTAVRLNHWKTPQGIDTGLRLRNSLNSSSMGSNERVESSPLTPLIVKNPKRVSWYVCGPTVYDVSHVGHGRTFVSLDIVQRVMRYHFSLELRTCMNITDIDDKIIRRASERDVDVRTLARKYEGKFRQDMLRLGVKEPRMITRVSEYISQIISYVDVIIQNGYAYESNGSVYFDVRALLRDDTAEHARLVPRQLRKSLEKQTDLTLESGEEVEKRHHADFALWRKAPPNEVGYDSPWGHGRPGWHVECSTMATSVFGDELDIHAGGIDLKFPHHENEVLQCQAHCANMNRQWPNYFLHVGHVFIDGRKMSKSLKNFISIEEFLQHHPSSLFRWICLMHVYDRRMEWSERCVKEAATMASHFDAFERRVTEAISILNDKLGDMDSLLTSESDREMLRLLDDTRDTVHMHLASNVDTPKALHSLVALCKHTTNYITVVFSKSQDLGAPILVLTEIHAYVVGVLSSFGVDIGTSVGAGDDSVDNVKLIDALVTTRSQIRQIALTMTSDKDGLSNQRAKLLSLVDELRDKTLLEFGVRVDDQQGKWRFESEAEKSAREAKKE